MKIKSGKIEGFEQYSQFNNLKDFNSNLEMWLVEKKLEFSKGELVGLKQLAQYAAKVPGVANAKIGTILKTIHEVYHDNGISRSTFKRMIIKAVGIGILSVHETERKNGSQSSNLYIFNRFPSNKPPKEEKLNHHKDTSNLLKTNKQEINKRKEETILHKKELDHTFVSSRIPQPFVDFAKCFFSDAKIIENYWHMVLIAAYRNNSEKETTRILATSILAFKQLIRKIKFTHCVKNPYSYFYGIIDKMFAKLYYEDLYDTYGS